MLIRCPKCSVSYDIGTTVIPAEGRKMRCSQCGETWVCLPQDLYEEQEEKVEETEENIPASSETDSQLKTEENIQEGPEETATTESTEKEEERLPEGKKEMQEIFARLETQTESLFEYEKNLPPHVKIWHRIIQVFGLHRRRNRQMLGGISVILVLLLLFYLRYDIVRAAPFMEKAYAALNIESVIPGEGLEFQNITRNEYEEDYVNKMEIRGFITNITDETINIPVLRIEMLDKNVQPLQVIYQEPPVQRVIAGSKVAFRVIVSKPSSFSKYVYMTFTREHPKETLKAVNIRPDDV